MADQWRTHGSIITHQQTALPSRPSSKSAQITTSVGKAVSKTDTLKVILFIATWLEKRWCSSNNQILSELLKKMEIERSRRAIKINTPRVFNLPISQLQSQPSSRRRTRKHKIRWNTD
jgi:hypothetical protein